MKWHSTISNCLRVCVSALFLRSRLLEKTKFNTSNVTSRKMILNQMINSWTWYDKHIFRFNLFHYSVIFPIHAIYSSKNRKEDYYELTQIVENDDNNKFFFLFLNLFLLRTDTKPTTINWYVHTFGDFLFHSVIRSDLSNIRVTCAFFVRFTYKVHHTGFHNELFISCGTPVESMNCFLFSLLFLIQFCNWEEEKKKN